MGRKQSCFLKMPAEKPPRSIRGGKDDGEEVPLAKKNDTALIATKA